jgi:hypothetical protein
MGSDPALSAEDEALVERLARRVVELRMEVPAVLALETGKPLSLVASQTLVFFEPLVQSLFSFPDYRRWTLLIERREVLEALARRIETLADERPGRRGSALRRSDPGKS